MRFMAIAVILVAAAAFPAQAGWESLMVASDASGSDCGAVGGTGLLQFHIFHIDPDGARGCRFRLYLPECLNSPELLEVSPAFNAVGDMLSGITVGYGQCVTSTVEVMTVTLLLSVPADDCCYVYLLPHPESSSRKAESFDCEMNPHDVPAHELIVNETPEPGCMCSMHCNHMLPWPENPYPPDGASNRDLDPVIAWDTVDPATVPSEHIVYFGTESDPPVVRDWYLEYTYDPGPLLPGTTYYWRVGVRTWCGVYESRGPVWRFTTRSDVPVEASTWGRIKSLYTVD